MPRAAGSGKHYDIGLIGVQGLECPACGLPGTLEDFSAPVFPQDQYVSVTTVLGATLPKDGLVGWAANIATAGMLDLAQNKGWDFRDPSVDQDMAKGLLQEFGFTSYAVRDEKAETGTRAHDVLETYGKTYLATDHNPYEAGLEAAQEKAAGLPHEEQGYGWAVIAWLEDRKPKPLIVETPMACHHHKVAGTGDLYWEATTDVRYQRLTEVRKQVSWELDMPTGSRVLTDLKTSKSFRESHFIQAAWYGGHMIPLDLGQPVDHQTVLRVNPDGTWEEAGTKPGQGPGGRTEPWTPQMFEALLGVYRLLKG